VYNDLDSSNMIEEGTLNGNEDVTKLCYNKVKAFGDDIADENKHI